MRYIQVLGHHYRLGHRKNIVSAPEFVLYFITTKIKCYHTLGIHLKCLTYPHLFKLCQKILDYNTHVVGRIIYGFKMAAENERFGIYSTSPKLIILVKQITIYRTETTTFHTRQFAVCIIIFQW